tara:strand:+ start:141 stop:548 length:408 start_codon:yes stop_codon:yes gene_type:complete
MNEKKPYLIDFDKIGDPSLGYISIVENNDQIPFEVQRVYWTYFTPNHVERGNHAHKELQQLIVAVSGVIEFTLISKQNERDLFILDNPDKGLYIPPGYWREMKFSHNAVLMCLASEIFNENDYIRNFKEFTTTKI